MQKLRDFPAKTLDIRLNWLKTEGLPLKSIDKVSWTNAALNPEDHDRLAMREKRRLQWEEMALETPRTFNPNFIGALENPLLRKHCMAMYRDLRRDVDNGYGISFLKDLLLKRIVWTINSCERLEIWMEKTHIDMLAGVEGAEELMAVWMRYYTNHTNGLVYLCKQVQINVPLIMIEPVTEHHSFSNDDKIMIED